MIAHLRRTFLLSLLALAAHAQTLEDGIAAYQRGDSAQTVTALSAVLHGEPYQPLALVLRGLAYAAQNRFNDAETDWMNAAQDPHLGTVADLLEALSHWRKGDPLDAKSWFGFCKPKQLGAAQCRAQAKRLAAGEPVPALEQWAQLAQISQAIVRFGPSNHAIARPHVTQAAPPPARVPPTPAAPPASAPATSAATPSAPVLGHYGCYFNNYPYGLWRSAIGYVEITSSSGYRDPIGKGRYRFDAASKTLHLVSGPLKDRVAHLALGPSGKPKITFERRDNDVGGKTTMDRSSTDCYLGQK